MLTREESNEVNEQNKIQYNKYRDSFLDDHITLFCTICGIGCHASDSTSHRGDKLICTNCLPSYNRIILDSNVENPDYLSIVQRRMKLIRKE